jgi:hypothetical protein
MPEQERTGESDRRATVQLSVEPDNASRFNVGTRWEVVASSLDSLWQGAHPRITTPCAWRGSDRSS